MTRSIPSTGFDASHGRLSPATAAAPSPQQKQPPICPLICPLLWRPRVGEGSFVVCVVTKLCLSPHHQSNENGKEKEREGEMERERESEGEKGGRQFIYICVCIYMEECLWKRAKMESKRFCLKVAFFLNFLEWTV